jgi:hypothetical protein
MLNNSALLGCIIFLAEINIPGYFNPLRAEPVKPPA